MNDFGNDGFFNGTLSEPRKKGFRINRLYWMMRRAWRRSKKDRSFRNLSKALPVWRRQVEQARSTGTALDTPFQRIALFGVLQYWIEQTTLLAATLAGLGKDVQIATMPYRSPNQWMNEGEIRKQEQKLQRILGGFSPYVQSVSLYQIGRDKPLSSLPEELEEQVKAISLRDVQYLLQIEEFNSTNPNTAAGRLYMLRLERNRRTALAALDWLQQERMDGILIPNGTVLETAAVYQVARYLDIPRVTYEFGEQRQRIWLAQNAEVMLQETDSLWEAYKDKPLTDTEWETIQALYSARQNADLWKNFSRRWQGIPSQGSQNARQKLGLDDRPIALLAANVIGDSLTLSRQVFSHSMTEWLVETVKFLMKRPNAQLIIRVHPGERYTKGPSVADQLKQSLGELPSHIHLVRADDPINTYDLIGLADLGLVYTTTAGLEMAMAGVPVVVSGKTHYRRRGFTVDPVSWEEYFTVLQEMLFNGKSAPLSEGQVNLAWNYAYRFFFDYPFDFPWRLHFFKQGDLEEWQLPRVLSTEGIKKFGKALSILGGAPIEWAESPIHEDILPIEKVKA